MDGQHLKNIKFQTDQLWQITITIIVIILSITNINTTTTNVNIMIMIISMIFMIMIISIMIMIMIISMIFMIMIIRIIIMIMIISMIFMIIIISMIFMIMIISIIIMINFIFIPLLSLRLLGLPWGQWTAFHLFKGEGIESVTFGQLRYPNSYLMELQREPLHLLFIAATCLDRLPQTINICTKTEMERCSNNLLYLGL